MAHRPIPPYLAPLLAASGVVLWFVAFVTLMSSLFGARFGEGYHPAIWIGAFVLGGLCHAGAILASLLRWNQRRAPTLDVTSGARQRRSGVPVVALLYLAVAGFAAASWIWSHGEDDRFLQANPDSFMVEEASGDAVRVRDAAGEWTVSLDTCPGRADAAVMGLGSRSFDGIADISYGDGQYYMRLHVSERRVECLSAAPEALNVYVGSYLDGGVEVDLIGDALVSREVVTDIVGDTIAVVVPTDAQWRAFRAVLDSLGVQQWRAAYANPGVDDGTQWTVNVVYSDWVVASGGDNGYPDANGAPAREAPEMPEVFRAFLAAVSDIAGVPIR